MIEGLGIFLCEICVHSSAYTCIYNSALSVRDYKGLY